MASPTRSARLRIPSYTSIKGGSSSDDGKNIILNLNLTRVQRDISDGAMILNFASFNETSLNFSILRYAITINGVIEETAAAHTAHAVSTGTEHEPDWIDLEEAAITFNNAAKPGGSLDEVPSLELNYGEFGDEWRVYKGVIQSLEMVRREGVTQVDFTLVFNVVYKGTDPSPVPTLRQWST